MAAAAAAAAPEKASKKRGPRTAAQKKKTRAVKRDILTTVLFKNTKPGAKKRLAQELRGALAVNAHPRDLTFLNKMGRYRKSTYRYRRVKAMKRGRGSISGRALAEEY